MKKTLGRTLKYWYVYAIAIAVAVTGSIYWCSFINRPRNEETISLFLCSYSQDMSKLREKLNGVAPSYLREINITTVNPKSADFSYYLVNKGLNQADIFLIDEENLFSDLVDKQFASLNPDIIKQYLPDYQTDSSGKGVLFHEIGAGEHPLIPVTNDRYEDENYYIFFRKNSLHLGPLNNSKSETALTFMKAMVEHG